MSLRLRSRPSQNPTSEGHHRNTTMAGSNKLLRCPNKCNKQSKFGMKPAFVLSLSFIVGIGILNPFVILRENVNDRRLHTQQQQQQQNKHLVRIPMYRHGKVSARVGTVGMESRNLQEEAEADDGHGTHFIDMFVGYPAQRRTMAVNTNSDFTSFPCLGCEDCGSTPLYDYEKSATFFPLECGKRFECTEAASCESDQCIISETLPDSSNWRAFETTDMVYIGGNEPLPDEEDGPSNADVARVFGFPLVFGCRTVSKGSFKMSESDGDIGMSSKPTSFINQMYDAGKLTNRAFSLCFSHASFDLRDGTSLGALTLGGYDPNYHNTPMVFAENTHAGDKIGVSFTVYLKKIFLRENGGQSVLPDREGTNVIPVDFDAQRINAPPGVAVDSGTPFTVLPQVMERSFRRAWRRIMGAEFSYGKVKLSEEELLRLPTLLFQLQSSPDVDRGIDPFTVIGMSGDLDPTSPYDVVIAVPATHYMEFNDNTGYYRSRITFEENGRTILGANVMQGHDVAFDLEHNRIGFAETSACVQKTTSVNPVVDDDLFAGFDVYQVNSEDNRENTYDYNQNNGPENIRPLEGSHDYEENIGAYGKCASVTCKSFMAVGYVAALSLAYVLWKCARSSRDADDDFGEFDEIEMDHAQSLTQHEQMYEGQGAPVHQEGQRDGGGFMRHPSERSDRAWT